MSLNSSRNNYPIIRLFKVIVSKFPNITAVTICEGLPGAVHMISHCINLLMKNCHRLRHFSIMFNYNRLVSDGGLWSVIYRTFERFFCQFGRQLLTFNGRQYT
ncbi:uncharacterized protein LOC128954395 [Oppia nitens]|uniref:uncharacterized protein LOC128954395 n=1 Tax=Oppia nitens TaxID=1686743 RepID=UPI0023DAD19A|nr:uncharacterized protein LOC128954395 [Oppia nitens]